MARLCRVCINAYRRDPPSPKHPPVLFFVSTDLQTWHGKAHRFGLWAADHWVDIVLCCSVGAIAVGAMLLADPFLERVAPLAGTKRTWLIGAGVVLTVGGILAALAGSYGSIQRSERISSLEKENAELKAAFDEAQRDVLTFAQAELKNAAKSLKFGSRPKNTERITIYSYDAGGFFTAFGRFSENPGYAKKSSRAQYEEDAGCIGAAWADGWYFDASYPDPADSVDAWVARCTQDGMKEEVARSIKMKSRLYCGFRIDSPNAEPIAVVVVESTDSNRYIESDLRSFFGMWGERLRQPFERFKPSLPRASSAREAGL